MFDMEKELPELNKRVLELIDKYSRGNVADFVGRVKLASHQKLNRCFNIDSRNGKYPEPSKDILQQIIVEFPEVSSDWLLTGEGEMLKGTEVKTDETLEANEICLYDVSAAAGYGSFDEIISREKVVDKFVIPSFKDTSWMIFVKGSSMYPKYSSGDIIACRVLYESQFIQWGKVYVIATKEQGMLVKRLEKSENEGYITAVSDNQTYKPFDIPKDEILGIALVIGVVRME